MVTRIVPVSRTRYNRTTVKAQKKLDTLVIRDSTPFVPQKSGVLRNSVITNTVIGSGCVVWKTPYAHYQYIGKDMIGVVSKRHYAMRYETKEYNGQILHYNEPSASAKWFEKAKRIHGRDWNRAVKEIFRNG